MTEKGKFRTPISAWFVAGADKQDAESALIFQDFPPFLGRQRTHQNTPSATNQNNNLAAGFGFCQRARALYARTVLFDVYLLRSNGRKLPPDEVKERHRRGYIELAKIDTGAPTRIATLRSERGGIADQLHCASVERITREGMIVVGWERPGDVRQAWWCVPVPPAGV